MGRRSFLVGLVTVALLASHAPPARTQPLQSGELKKQVKTLKQRFPEFESRKGNLGTLSLLADVVVIEDVRGDVENVFREDSKDVGQKLLDTLTAGLTNKGYAFTSSRLVSVGSVITDASQYRVLDRWEQREQDASQFPLLSRPVYQDSTLGTSDSLRTDWHELMSGVWSFRMKKNQPTPTLPSVANLRSAIGTDYAMVVVLVATRTTLGRLLAGSALAGVPVFGKKTAFKLEFSSWEDVHFDKDVDFDKYSGLGLRLAVVDCRTGEVLYSDADHDRWSLDGARLDILVSNVIRRTI